MTVSELIAVLGGRTKVAAACGVGPSAVSNWKKLGAIPPQYGFWLEALCEDQGVALNRQLFRQMTEAERRNGL